MLAGNGVIRTGEGAAKTGYGSKRSSIKRSSLKKILIPPHPLTNFEIEAYYQNESRFNDIFSRDNLPERSSTEKIKNGAYIISLDEYSVTYSVKTVAYFDSFRVY